MICFRGPMINKNSIEAVADAKFQHDFCRPLYTSYCFSKIPATVKRLLGEGSGGLPLDCTDGATYDKVVLLFIDGFGWRFFETYKDKYPFLKRFINNGIVSKITSQFPSTTAAHVSCLNTGMEVGESGIYEWFYYEPRLDRVIAPLLFSYAGDKEIGTLGKAKVDPHEIYPEETFYLGLQAPAFIFQSETIANSPCTKAMFRGATHRPYTKFSDALQDLSKLMETTPRGYFYVYLGDIDAQAHRHGIASKEAAGAVEACFSSLETYLKLQPKTALIMIADHGMTEIDPKTTVYLNREIPKLESYIRKNRSGKLLTPAGSCRDYFLHVENERIPEVEALLAHHLGDKAFVYRTEELIEDGLFGSKEPSTAFLSRVGNLVILPVGHNSVWWYEKGRFEQKFLAMHGGLTRDEMETIFLFSPA
jgi:predicted AlkP superfamily pyrophosphatase or phosphodiesterase